MRIIEVPGERIKIIILTGKELDEPIAKLLSEKVQGSKKIVCYGCRGEGHFKRECPSVKKVRFQGQEQKTRIGVDWSEATIN